MNAAETDLIAAADAAAQTGMTSAFWAKVRPGGVAVYDPSGKVHTLASVNANANRLVRLLRARGLQVGDAVALVLSNRAEFVEVLAATQRAGFRLTPVNWHLTEEELAYIVADCDAQALIAEARAPAIAPAAAKCPKLKVKLAIDGDLPGFESYETGIGGFDGSDIGDPMLGSTMLYTSGTTGRPKGVFRPRTRVVNPPSQILRRDYDPAMSVQLCAGPSYHAAPLGYDVRAAMSLGIPLVFLDKWDSETVLRTIAERRISHMHMVPIMFQRLLALPETVKAQHPLDSLRYVVHGAAPCPPEVKRAMIDWFGPIISEYYSASEGGAGWSISSEEWLRKPGSVGKLPDGADVRFLDDEGKDVPRGHRGGIYTRLPVETAFSYYKDPTKTEAARVDGYFTLGDVGYLDEDGYLFLTGRNAETIISGGVNIYPQEVDNVLIQHPAVADSATIGAPHDEWGEQVKAVVVLQPDHTPSPELAAQLLAFARAGLPSFKVPRSVDFVDSLPRSEAGKIQRNKVRAPYWAARARQI